jgi:hypothetical protein
MCKAFHGVAESRELVVSSTTLSGTKLVERPWACPRCGAHGVVTRHARRPWRWRRERLRPAAPKDTDDTSWEVPHEATRMLSMIRCPACHAYAPRVVFWSGVRLVGSTLTAMTLVAIASVVSIVSKDVQLAGVLLWVSGVFGLGVVGEVKRWRAARRATVLRLRPGPSQNQLPKAVVHRLASPAIVPIESTAPEPVEQADDASGPRFLHSE